MKIFKNVNNSVKIIFTICLTLFMLISVIIHSSKEYEETVLTSSSLNNQKIGWGIKRNDNHNQPDLGANNKKLIEKYNGIALGNSEEKKIYLTFDLGYEAGYTANILDVLKEKNVSATFFITAHYLNSASELVERMISEGHIVGNHTPNYLMSGSGKV